MNETFHKTLTDRHTETSNRLNGLNNRISELEARFVREKADILALIDQRGRELAEMLNKFKVRGGLQISFFVLFILLCTTLQLFILYVVICVYFFG